MVVGGGGELLGAGQQWEGCKAARVSNCLEFQAEEFSLDSIANRE